MDSALTLALTDHPRLLGFAVTLVAVGVVLGAVTLASLLRGLTTGGAPRRPVVSPPDAEDRARARRIAADDLVWSAVGLRTAPVLDNRTAELAIDPTLKAAEVAEMVGHVAPGEGSVVSVSAEPVDTRLRTHRQLVSLAAAEEAAYAEADEREARKIFAEFDGRLAIALSQFRTAPAVRRADAWLHYVHGEHDDCPRCAEAVAEVSGEYRQIVGRYSTQEIDVRELRRALAAV